MIFKEKFKQLKDQKATIFVVDNLFKIQPVILNNQTKIDNYSPYVFETRKEASNELKYLKRGE